MFISFHNLAYLIGAGDKTVGVGGEKNNLLEYLNLHVSFAEKFLDVRKVRKRSDILFYL